MPLHGNNLYTKRFDSLFYVDDEYCESADSRTSVQVMPCLVSALYSKALAVEVSPRLRSYLVHFEVLFSYQLNKYFQGCKKYCTIKKSCFY